MPNTKSAMKRVRQSEAACLRNRSEKNAVRTVRRQLKKAIESGNKEASNKLFGGLCSVLDKAEKHGVMRKNTCNRYKSRAQVRINALGK